jgi:hypothetical protein
MKFTPISSIRYRAQLYDSYQVKRQGHLGCMSGEK